MSLQIDARRTETVCNDATVSTLPALVFPPIGLVKVRSSVPTTGTWPSAVVRLRKTVSGRARGPAKPHRFPGISRQGRARYSNWTICRPQSVWPSCERLKLCGSGDAKSPSVIMPYSVESPSWNARVIIPTCSTPGILIGCDSMDDTCRFPADSSSRNCGNTTSKPACNANRCTSTRFTAGSTVLLPRTFPSSHANLNERSRCQSTPK